MTLKKLQFLYLFLLSAIIYSQTNASALQLVLAQKEHINNIYIKGLSLLPEDTILNKIPFEKGDLFEKEKTIKAIKNIYELGYFKQVHFKTHTIKKGLIDLYVFIEEKIPLKEIIFKGNKALSTKDLKKKLGELVAAEEPELKKYAAALEQYYAEKNYHFAKVTTSLQVEDKKGIAIFTIKEGPVALVKKVRFHGNNHFSGKRLRSLLFTREDWILGVMDRAGTYNPLAVEQDRDTLEKFYQSNGYLHAKVPKADIAFDAKKQEITITFDIQEGDLYTISHLSAPGNDEISEEQLLERIPLRVGQLYSRELVRFSIEQIRNAWGAKGYIYADVEPSIEPDDEKKTVAISFYSQPGNTVRVNRIHIFGNQKGRDKIIRRQLTFEEGDLVTTQAMEESKARVSQLGYFDLKEGINWKINRLTDDTADLDLLVKEIKTGRFEWKTSYGGSPTRLDSPNTGLMAEFTAMDRNLLGKGLYAQLMGRLGAEEKALTISFAEPWFCDKPIRIGFDGFFNHATYDEIKKVEQPVGEKQLGASWNVGFVSKKLDNTAFLFDVGFQNVDHLGPMPKASISSNPVDQAEYQLILDERFKGGQYAFFQAVIRKNTLNHHLHITEGIKLDFSSRIAIPSIGRSPIGFYKIEGDGHWYTSLIGDYLLVFHGHIHAGLVSELGKRQIPYRELYNIGGPASVRAWRFGQLSPLWYTSGLASNKEWLGEPIGGKKAFFINLELVFPMTDSMTIKGCIFYDGGAGWDTPDARTIVPSHLKNNKFDYRHCIGVGLRLLEPQPIRFDWGFKLDPRKGESSSEVQFSGYYDF